MEARVAAAAAACEVGGLDSLRATELRLGLPGTEDSPRRPPAAAAAAALRQSKRAFSEVDENRAGGAEAGADAENPPPAKAQVVGWPPVRSYRKSCLQGRKVEAAAETTAPGAYVKVSMDGAPYLRKVDLGAFRGYRELRDALEGMFVGFSLGFSAGEEACGGSEHAITYQDKDGDWMLAGDVPWEMFKNSCKRLRIMKGCDARGLGSS